MPDSGVQTPNGPDAPGAASSRTDRSVRFVTFGCKANQYDTQVLREALVRRGWDEKGKVDERPAGVVVVNTCTVTAEAGRKARQLIRRIAREEPATKVAVTGCLAESEPEILRELPGVEWVFGNGEAKRPISFLREIGEEISPEELGIPSGITEFSGHTRAFLKIQDGCDKACAFCIIPSVRGKSTSRSIPELSAEVRRLLDAGHREIVLCGIHIGLWGADLGATLADLMEALAAIELGAGAGPPGWRLRLSSIEATEVDDRLLELMPARPERIAPHLHMPMQSGDDKVLRAMNRWYDVDEYLASVERVQAALDAPALSADLLVGFPGEGQAEFANTLRTVERIGFSRIHIFPFSARPGTAAADMDERPAPTAVRERRAEIGDLARRLQHEFRSSLDGRRDTLLLEEGNTGLSGRYQRVELAATSARSLSATGAEAGPARGLLEIELERVGDRLQGHLPGVSRDFDPKSLPILPS
jgi:threonylcarbamoyladenosine tRNA methylthiotransferase MtaB